MNWIATARLNYRAGGLGAVCRMPIKVYGPLRMKVTGRIELPKDAGRNTLIIGSEHEDYTAAEGKAQVDIGGTLRIGGMVRIGPDSFVGIAPGAVLEFGDGCHIGRDSQIHCYEHISFGKGVLSGELYATDSTAHRIIRRGEPQDMTSAVIVEDNVYLCFRTMLLSGCRIPSGAVVASGAVCVKDYTKVAAKNVLLTGIPAEVKEMDVTYERMNF